MKLFERCIHTIDRIARIPDENAEQITRMGLEEFGKAATGKSLTEMLERIQIPKSNEHIFPEYFMDYMAATMEYLKHSMRPENGVNYDWEMALVNSYKSEFYRHAAFNFVSNNKMIIRLTDECAEYIDDVRLTAVNISDIDFPKNKFTLLFRMNERTFVILVQRDEYGIRVTGVNTTIDIEHEPAFASHIILFDTQKKNIESLVREDIKQWKEHVNITQFKYVELDQGLQIVQHRLRAFVLKFLFMYNHKMVDTKQDSETGKKVSINQINRDLRKNTYTCRYVSLSQKDQADFAHHKKVKAALKSVSEHKWFKPWWPVGPYIRTVQGRIMHVKGYFAHRKAGKIEHDQEIVVTI